MTSNKKSAAETPLAESRERLVEDLQTLIADAQNLAKEVKSASGDALEEKVEQARESLRVGVEKLRSYGDQACEVATSCSQDIDEAVRSNPWRAVGIAALGGFVLSLILRRR